MPADRQVHPPPGVQQFVGDLAPGRAAAHDEHRPVRQVRWASIPCRVGLPHRRRDVLRQLRDAPALDRTGCDEDAPRMAGSVSRGHHEAVAVAVLGKADDVGVLAHRRPGTCRVLVDDAKDLAVVGEAVGIVAGVGVAGQLQLPVRELKAQRVPAFGAPPFADATPFQHHVFASTAGAPR